MAEGWPGRSAVPGDVAVCSWRTEGMDCSSWTQGDMHLAGASPKSDSTYTVTQSEVERNRFNHRDYSN